MRCPASTGPPLIEAEDDRTRRQRRGIRARASTGPPLIEAEDAPHGQGARPSDDDLQRGRLSSRRRTTARASSRTPSFTFNGAASHRGGGPGTSTTSSSRCRAFNGAASHRGGGRDPAVHHHNCRHHPSTGPPLIEAEDWPAYRVPPTALRLPSTGPPLIEAEDDVSRRERLDQHGPSTGPPLIEAEDATALTWGYEARTPSTGPPLIEAEDRRAAP